MSVPIAYGLAIIIWSTTPLAIVISNESLPPLVAAMLRMCIAAALGVFMLKLFKLRFNWHWYAFRAYLASVVGIFGAMGATYLAAQWVPSGLISVLFGLTTIATGALGHFFLNDKLSIKQWLSVVVGLIGLAIVFTDQLVISGQGIYGVLFCLAAVMLFSISNILMKRFGSGLHPVQQTVGGLWCSLPFYALASFVSGSVVEWQQVSINSMLGVAYLAILGSLVGFVAYFHLIAKLAPAYVALITLVTPVIALFIGSQLYGEPVTAEMLIGAAIILSSLLFFMSDNFIRLYKDKRLNAKAV